MSFVSSAFSMDIMKQSSSAACPAVSQHWLGNQPCNNGQCRPCQLSSVLRCSLDPSLTPLPALVPLQIFYQLQMGDDIMALIASVPRTMRTLQWAVQAGIGYKRLLSGLDPNLNPDAYAVQLSRLHDFWAQVRTCCPGCV